MILDAEGILALMRVQGERDLAIVAIVASMVDSLPDSARRLAEIEKVMGEYRKTLDGRSQRREVSLTRHVLEMLPGLRKCIDQLALLDDA